MARRALLMRKNLILAWGTSISLITLPLLAVYLTGAGDRLPPEVPYLYAAMILTVSGFAILLVVLEHLLTRGHE